MQDEAHSRSRQLIATLAVLIVVVAIVASIAVTNKRNQATADGTDTTAASSQTASTSTNTSATNSNDNTTTSATNSSGYSDNTYSAEGEYQSPGGTEYITISVTVKDGIITATTATSGADNSESQEYQDMFISGYKTQVVGKSLATVSLSRVSGSSLTSQGFNDAIDQIRSDASAG